MQLSCCCTAPCTHKYGYVTKAPVPSLLLGVFSYMWQHPTSPGGPLPHLVCAFNFRVPFGPEVIPPWVKPQELPRFGVLLPRMVYPPVVKLQELPDVAVVPLLHISAAKPAVTQAVQGKGHTDRWGIEGCANLLRLVQQFGPCARLGGTPLCS